MSELFFISYVGNSRSPPITEKISVPWDLLHSRFMSFEWFLVYCTEWQGRASKQKSKQERRPHWQADERISKLVGKLTSERAESFEQDDDRMIKLTSKWSNYQMVKWTNDKWPNWSSSGSILSAETNEHTSEQTCKRPSKQTSESRVTYRTRLQSREWGAALNKQVGAKEQASASKRASKWPRKRAKTIYAIVITLHVSRSSRMTWISESVNANGEYSQSSAFCVRKSRPRFSAGDSFLGWSNQNQITSD